VLPPPGPGHADATRAGASASVEETSERRTRFKIFFGFAPGVGKTYRMLQVARDLVAEGVDVVIGAVETHGRYDTAGLALGLEVLPRRSLPHRGRVLDEFDLDAALARRPKILLLDELAHTNAPGSRHARRWQDVVELLAAGIEVYATLNVQHVESLNDVVSQITHVQVRESVPDSVLERADEVELVDIAPEELLQRLREGKVHLPEQAAAARDHFFKRGSLLALRELALRRMAERVDAEVIAYREAHGVDTAWPTAERVLVCVGPAPDSARLVRAGRRIAAGLRAPWVVAAVEATGRPPLGEEARDRLEAHLLLGESLGAEVVRLSAVRVPEAVLAYARRRNVTRIVLGKPRHPRWRDRLRGSLVDEIIRGSGDIEVNVLSGAEEDEGRRTRPPRREAVAPAREYVRAAAIIAITTGVAAAVRAASQVPDVEMLFLLGVMIVALTSGRRASILAAALAVASYDFFFVPPAYTLNVSDARYFLTFAMMLGTGVVIGTLTLRLREQQRAAVVREQRASALYALSRELAAAVDDVGAASACVRAVAEGFDCEVVFLAARGRDTLEPVAAAPRDASLGASETAVAQWVLEHGRLAGRGTDTLSGEPVLCVPLRTWGDVLAVIAVRVPAERRLAGDQRELLDALGRQTAVALDRVRLADEARRAALRAKTEELRSALLSAVSHDLRTPLAAITGAGTLLLESETADPELRRELTITVVEEAERLERLVSNLLDMTRLESGVVEPRREWVPLVEVIGSAMTRLERVLEGRPVTTVIDEGVPLLSIDPILVGQLFVNLLENAAKYTPPGTEITVRAVREGGTLLVDVADRGPGIPPGEEERVFERFHRAAQPGVGGVGLGLPIARAIAQAHGGRLTAANRLEGGAVFRLTLPILAPPTAPVEPAESSMPLQRGVGA
jgi:two-component system sensor histidine kinase KdpD